MTKVFRVLATIALLTLVACDAEAEGSAYYSPPVIPVTFQIDHDGSIHILLNPQIVTPIGTFGVEMGVSANNEKRSTVLVIRHLKDGVVVDDAFRVHQDIISIDVDGSTRVEVSEGRVFVDASKGNVRSIQIGPVESDPVLPSPFLSQNGIPSGDTTDVTPDAGTVHVFTSGPISVAGVSLPGGTRRGSVVVFLPGATYHLTNLVPTQNWHGAYRIPSEHWPLVISDRVAAMLKPANCTVGGCETVDWLVVGPGGVVDRGVRT